MSARILIIIGGLALLAATFVDTIAVILRHVGFPISGSIEAMQAVVLVSGAIGLVMSTWEDSHARVKLLVDRLPPARRGLADLLSNLLTLAFILALLTGSVWLAADLWGGHEQSELLGVPWAALRLIANVCLGMVVVLLMLRMAGKLRQ